MPKRPLALQIVFLTGLRLVFNTAQRFVYPFLPAIARGLGVSLGQAGIIVSARWMVGLAAPGVVALVGRGERRLRLAAFGALMLVVGASVTAATGVFWGALVGFVLFGIAKPAFDIAAQSYIADRTPYERRARALSVLEMTWAGGLLVGAPLAGWLIDRGGWRAPFWAIAVGGAVGLMAMVFVLDRDEPDASTAPTKINIDAAAVSFLVVVGLFTIAAELMFVAFGAWLENSFGLSLVALGGTAVIVGLAEIVGEGSVFAFGDRIGKRRAMSIGLMISAGGFLALAFLQDSYALGIAALALGLAGFEFAIVISIPLGTEIRPMQRAGFLSLMVASMSLARAVGALAGPVMFETWGLSANAVAAASLNLAAIWMLRTTVRVH